MKKIQIFIMAGIILLSVGICQASVNVTLAWNPSLTDVNGQTLTTPAGYRLFYSDTSGVYSQYVDVGSSTEASVQGLEYNKTYFFMAKAYTASGESAYSDEVTWVAPAMAGATVDVTLEWNPSLTDVNGQPIMSTVGYKLFYSDTSGVYSQYVDVGSSNLADVTGLGYNKTYFFKAKAYTANGESAYSEELAWNAPVMPDTDTDGISDSWEQEHFNTTGVAQSATDSDLDGCSDLHEFLAGTNPADSDDYPTLSIQPCSTGATIAFQAKQAFGAGYENRARYYTLLRCDDLSKGIWTSVPGQENIPAADQIVSCAAPADSRNVFYRTDVRLD